MKSTALASQVFAMALLAGLSGFAAPSSWGAEVKIGPNTVQKILTDQLFTRSGRWYLLDDGPCYAYLESPQTRLEQGRIWLDAHLSSRIGQRLGNYCVGAGFASGVTISAQALGRGSTLTLGDIRIDHVDDGATAALVSLLRSVAPDALPRAFHIDVLQSVRGNPIPLAGYTISVGPFDIQNVVTNPDGVTVHFDFALASP